MKTAMIWGASGGIGRALLQALVQDEWTVVALSRNVSGLEEWTPHVIEADPCDEYAIKNATIVTSMEVSAVDLWVYAAGDITSAKVAGMKAADWQRILDANLTGPYLTAHHSLPLLAENAHLVFLGAVSERLRLPGLTAYAAAKAGLEAFAEALGKEERRRRVTVARPGAVTTPLWDKVPMNVPKNAATPEKIAAKILAAHHDGHKGTLDLT